MEADWAAEIGPDLPTIVVPWEGFLDLRENPGAIRRISEAAVNPELARALIELNGEDSHVFTAKCDAWALKQNEIDPLEFDASIEETAFGFACYIDILSRTPKLFGSFERHEAWVRSAVTALRAVGLRCARVELVIRAARIDGQQAFGLTQYVASCGPSDRAARSTLRAALIFASAITMKQAATAGE